MSDLLDNANRGLLAEYLVGRALGCAFDHARQSWDDFDLLTPTDVRVEVKTTGRFQSWHVETSDTESRNPSFTGLRGQALTPDRSKYQGNAEVRADVFVFCYHQGRQPLCIKEWEFYVVSGPRIDALQQKSIRLSRIRKLTHPLSFSTLRRAVELAWAESRPPR